MLKHFEALRLLGLRNPMQFMQHFFSVKKVLPSTCVRSHLPVLVLSSGSLRAQEVVRNRLITFLRVSLHLVSKANGHLCGATTHQGEPSDECKKALCQTAKLSLPGCVKSSMSNFVPCFIALFRLTWHDIEGSAFD